MLSVVNDDGTTPEGSPIDEIAREGVRRMRAAALDAEVDRRGGERGQLMERPEVVAA